jgi:hypothetical protein
LVLLLLRTVLSFTGSSPVCKSFIFTTGEKDLFTFLSGNGLYNKVEDALGIDTPLHTVKGQIKVTQNGFQTKFMLK